ncbi:MAG: tetratricopeptide repeat protein, partial [Anaerolineae bacterium]|nr:tetratricopeptide repeat protein [Anaerolineae bacterium]
PLIGREAELAAVQARLEQPACRLLTLTGLGGIGKTRLAIETARHRLAGFPDGAFMVLLAPLQEPGALIPAIAQAIGLSLSDEGGPQAQQLRNYLRDKTLLLLLDNAEHLVEAPGAPGDDGVEDDLTARQPNVGTVVSDILAAAPGVKVLVTSRARLNVLGEYVVPVDALVYPDESAARAEAVAHLPSVQLFVQSAQRLLPSFALNETTCAAVVGICRCVQGHPLALLLTAAWTTTLPVAEIAAALADHGPDADSRRLDMLRADWRNVPGRHRSLRAVFEHSWRLLSLRERAVFQALALFRGGFTRAAAQDVAGAVPRDLRALVNASLLSRGSSGRYTMHELLRQYGAEKLSRDPVAARRVHQRYCTYYGDALTAWAEDAKGPRQQVMLDEMDAEIDNARAAWDWAVEAEELAFIDQAVHALSLYYARRVRRQEGADACRAAATLLEALIAAEPSNQGEVLRILSRVLQRYGWFHLAERRLEAVQRSLAVLDEPALVDRDVRSERAGALRSLGDMMMETDRHRAEQHYTQSLDLYRALGEDWEEAQVLTDLGWCAWHVNSLKKARGFLEKALRLARALGDVRTVSDAMMGLSGVALSSGELHEAARLSEEVLALRRELGYLFGIAGALYSLGNKRTMLAQLPEAISLLEECIRIRRDQLGLPVPFEVSMLGWAEMYAGRYDRAERHARTAYEIMRARGDPRGLGWTQFVLGGILLGQERFGEAEGVLQGSLEAYHPLQQWMEIAGALALLGYARCMQGRFEEA